MQSSVHLLPAEEGLPNGEPLLLRHIEVCCAGLEADRMAVIADVAPAVPLMSGTNGVSQWAHVLAEMLQTLGLLLSSRGADVTEATAAAVVGATLQLIDHEVATREPLQLPGTEAATADSDARLQLAANTCLRLRGPAATAAQHSSLQKMAVGLTVVSEKLAEVLPAHAAASASGAAPRPAASHADQGAMVTAMTVLANDACCIARFNAICLSSQGPQHHLAADCDSGRAWTLAIGGALATVARCFELNPLSTSEDFVMTTIMAAFCLAGLAGALLQHRVAAGMEALQEEASVQLVEAMASYVVCESQTLAAHVRSCADNCNGHQGRIVEWLASMQCAHQAEAVLFWLSWQARWLTAAGVAVLGKPTPSCCCRCWGTASTVCHHLRR